MKLSGAQIGASNLAKFNSWVMDRKAANDWPDYIRRGLLNRSEIAAECGFALSVLRQNPAVRTALDSLEAELRLEGILRLAESANRVGFQDESGVQPRSASTIHAFEARLASAAALAEKRLKQAEEQNASLRAEIVSLKQKLRQYALLQEHLEQTGRLLPT